MSPVLDSPHSPYRLCQPHPLLCFAMLKLTISNFHNFYLSETQCTTKWLSFCFIYLFMWGDCAFMRACMCVTSSAARGGCLLQLSASLAWDKVSHWAWSPVWLHLLSRELWGSACLHPPTLGSRMHSATLACMRTSGIQTRVLTPTGKHSYALSLLFSPQSTALQRTSLRTLQEISTASMTFRFSKYFVILPPNKCTFCEMLQKTLKHL